MGTLQELRYPIGYFECPKEITANDLVIWTKALETFPIRLEEVIVGFTNVQFETPYRAGGWTVRQVIHHIADSHHHSYTRFKWALTEKTPLIKTYEEKSWSTLLDARTAPIALSINYIRALHSKLVYLLMGMSEEQLLRCYIHPEENREISVAENIGKYAWHGDHHLAHIQQLVIRKGW